jgi:hypothetical protein
MRELLTTILDAVGLLLLAAGVGGGLYQWIGLWCLTVSGVVILGGSLFAASQSEPKGEKR